MSLIPRCCVCDDPLPNPYSGGACCGGTYCKRYEAAETERLTVSERDPMKRRAA